jgi:hypothetical protein
VGEVIEACTSDFVAQCYELYNSPALGCLVKTKLGDQTDAYGVVSRVQTAGIEPGRRPIARGKAEASEDEIYRSSPQLYKLLRSEFDVIVVGFRDSKSVFQCLPPRPARIHAFVHICTPPETRLFSQSLDFLTLLLNAQTETAAGELIGASLREMSLVYGEGRHDFLVAAGKELATLLSRDYIRLKSILKGLRYGATG